MNWTFKMVTIVMKELPFNCYEQECNMVCQLIYLMKVCNILLALVVNNDHIGAHVIPTIKGWENKWTKHIFGVEDKGQIMTIIFSTTNMVLFTFQIVFEQVLLITIY